MFEVMTLDEAMSKFAMQGYVAFGLEPGDMTLYELFILRCDSKIIFGKTNAGNNGVIAAAPGDNVGPFSFAMIGCEHTRKVLADAFHWLTGWSDHFEFTWNDGRIVR